MMDEQQQPPLIPVPLDAGIDISSDDKGQPNGVRQMINLSFAGEGAVSPRGSFSRLSETADLNLVSGGLLPMDAGLPESRPSYKMPLETEVIGKYATAARLLEAQLATFQGYTVSALLVRNEDTSSDAVSGTVAQAYVQINLYDATTHKLLNSTKSASWGDVQDVKITSSAIGAPATVRYWLITYVDPTNSILRSRVVSVDTASPNYTLTVSAATNLLTGVQTAYTTSHAVEMNSTSTRWLVFGWTTSLRYVEVDASGTPGTIVTTTDTTFTSSNYEMASMRSPDGLFVWVASGSTSSTNIAVYKMDLSTQAVTRYSHSLSGVTFTNSRLALVSWESQPSDCCLIYELPSASINKGINAVFVSASSGLQGVMGAVQGLALADAGSWLSENARDSDTGIKVGVIGLMSVEAQDNGYHSHVVARVHGETNSSGTFAPALYASATLAHSDAGVYRRMPLSKWSRISDTEIELPVTYLVRTTADRGLLDDAGTGYDVFDRAVRRTRLKSQAREARGLVRLGPNTYVGGSVPMSWDGKYLTPAGFPLPPHSVKVADNGVTAGAIAAGTYVYRTKSVYQDAVGTLFDSPLVVMSSEEITTASTHTPVLTVYPGALWFETDSQHANAPRFTTEVYRNPDTLESGDETSRKAYSVSHYADAANVNIIDKKSSTDIATGELLPDLTNGEILSGPLPALKHIWAHRSRLFGIDMYDPELVWFTTEYAAPTAPRWNETLTARVSNSGKDCIGGASLADKVVVFQEDQIAVMSGEGPDGTGRGSFTLPESLRGVGAMKGTQGAIVEVPTGVMFVHRTGIYLLGFDLSLQFVGAKLTKKLGGLPSIKRAVHFVSRGEVWFLTDGTPHDELGAIQALVWDLTRSRWTAVSSSLGPFSDAIEVQGTVYLQDTQGRLLEAHSASNGAVDRDEDGTAQPYNITVKLPQLRIDSAHKMRLRKIHIGGSQSSADMTLTASVETYNESRGEGGELNTYAYETDLTGYGQSFQIPLRAVTQRCTALQCTLTLTVNDAIQDNEITLAKLEYEVSVLPGTGKVAQAKRPEVTAV